MKIEWTEPAAADLQGIFDYIAADAPIYARRMVETILEGVDLLEKFPERGRKVPEAARPDIREIWVSPFRVIY